MHAHVCVCVLHAVCCDLDPECLIACFTGDVGVPGGVPKHPKKKYDVLYIRIY